MQSEPPAVAGGFAATSRPPATAGGSDPFSEVTVNTSD